MERAWEKSTHRLPYLRLRKDRGESAGRVALLLVGELRTLEFCLKRQLSKIQSAKSVHIFLATWDRTKPSIRQNLSNSSIVHVTANAKDELVEVDDLKTRFPIIDEISVVSQSETEDYHTAVSRSISSQSDLISLLDTQEQGISRGITEEYVFRDIYVTLNQLFLLERAAYMMTTYETSHSVQFDYVIRSRPDILFTKEVVWPNDNELIVDCLKSSRRRKGNLFDGFFISPRNFFMDIAILYQKYVDVAESQKLSSSYGYDYSVVYGPLEFLYNKRVGKNIYDGFLVNENFIRSTYASLPDLHLVDARLGVKIVR